MCFGLRCLLFPADPSANAHSAEQNWPSLSSCLATNAPEQWRHRANGDSGDSGDSVATGCSGADWSAEEGGWRAPYLKRTVTSSAVTVSRWCEPHRGQSKLHSPRLPLGSRSTHTSAACRSTSPQAWHVALIPLTAVSLRLRHHRSDPRNRPWFGGPDCRQGRGASPRLIRHRLCSLQKVTRTLSVTSAVPAVPAGADGAGGLDGLPEHASPWSG